MKDKLKSILLIVFYLIFLVGIFLLAYFELPKVINLNRDSEEIKVIKNIYSELEDKIPTIATLRGDGLKVAVAIIDEESEYKSIKDLFASNFEIETIYKEKNEQQGDYELCLNRYNVFNDERIYTEKCHDLNTIEYFNRKNLFKLETQEPTKMVYSFTTQYKENDKIVYTDYEVTLSYIDNTWKISDGVIVLSTKDAEYFVYIDTLVS